MLKLQSSEGSELAIQFAAVQDRDRNQADRPQTRHSFAVGAHFRRIAIVLLSAACRTWIPFLLLGALNRFLPIFASVFFCYAGNERYARHYSYKSCRNFLLWFPSTIGVFRQGKKWGLICAAPVTEAEFADPKKSVDLGRLLRRLQLMKTILGVDKLSFAGILPTILNRRWPETINDGVRDHTPEVVRMAIHEVRRKHFDGRLHDIVLLGGAGRIGRAVYECLQADGIDSVVVDPAARATTAFTVQASASASILLVDVSRHGAIQCYVDKMPEGSVVLNEVFPEPSREVLAELANRNIATYHIAGIAADVYPSLPLRYKNALPCCAIHSSDIGEPILKRIA
jgi:hypothetical protein